MRGWVWRVGLLGLLALGVVGCGRGLYPVHGRVTFADGQPVTSGLVIFEGKDEKQTVTARGAIHTDGTFRLATHKPGDGAPAGKYRVLLVPPPPQDPDVPQAKAPFDERYLEFGTSGLEFDVKAGTNELPIQVSRPKRGRR